MGTDQAARRRWIVTAAVLAVAAIGVAAFFAFNRSPARTLRAAMAEALQVAEAQLELNIPPLPSRYPGALLVSPDPHYSVLLRVGVPDGEASVVLSRLEGSFGGAMSSTGGFDGSPLPAALQAASSADVEASFVLDDVRVFEWTLPQLKASLEDEDLLREVQRLVRENRPVRVVDRAYEGRLEFRFKRRASAQSESWLKLQEAALKGGGRVVDARTFAWFASEPQVFAFRSLDASVVSTQLGSQGLDVELREQPRAEALNAFPVPTAFGLAADAGGVGFWVGGTAQYSSAEFGDLRVVESSRELVSNTLSAMGAERLLADEPVGSGYTQEELLTTLDRVAAEAVEKGLSTVVIYYVGHAVSVDSGQVYLVGENYRGDLKTEIGEQRMFGLARFGLEQPQSPLGGSNISDLLDVVVAAQGQYPEELPGLTPVSELAQRESLQGLRLVLLVDGCFPSRQMEALRDALYLAPNGDYAGPGEMIPLSTLDAYRTALRQFSQAPYLRSENPVVFAAVPGFAGYEQPMPAPHWEQDARVGPLADKVWRVYERVLLNGESISWGEYLQRLADVRPIGEFRVSGTVSWSDFSALKAVPALTVERP